MALPPLIHIFSEMGVFMSEVWMLMYTDLVRKVLIMAAPTPRKEPISQLCSRLSSVNSILLCATALGYYSKPYTKFNPLKCHTHRRRSWLPQHVCALRRGESNGKCISTSPKAWRYYQALFPGRTDFNRRRLGDLVRAAVMETLWPACINAISPIQANRRYFSSF